MGKSKAINVLDNLKGVSREELLHCALTSFAAGMARLTDERDGCAVAGEILDEIIGLLAKKQETMSFGDMAVVATALVLMITAEFLEDRKMMNGGGVFTAAKQSTAVN